MKSIKKLIVPILIVLMVLVGCSKQVDKNKEAKTDLGTENKSSNLVDDTSIKTIYVTSYPLYDFTKSIVGDKAEVINITNNKGFHGWEPSAKDIADVQKADMFIYSGPGLEKWVDDLIANGTISGNIISASEGLDLLTASHSHDHEDHDHEDHDHEDHDKESFDPHIWLSLRNAQIILENIKNSLVDLDPVNKDFYEANCQERTEAFKALDEKFTDSLANTKRDSIVVSHEAYGYLARDYNFKQVGIEGINAEGEPSLKQIDNIISVGKENDVRVIFYEQSISPKTASLIAKELGADLELLSPLESLSQDQINEGKDYLTVMEDNLEVINKALNE